MKVPCKICWEAWEVPKWPSIGRSVVIGGVLLVCLYFALLAFRMACSTVNLVEWCMMLLLSISVTSVIGGVVFSWCRHHRICRWAWRILSFCLRLWSTDTLFRLPASAFAAANCSIHSSRRVECSFFSVWYLEWASLMFDLIVERGVWKVFCSWSLRSHLVRYLVSTLWPCRRRRSSFQKRIKFLWC